MISIIGQIWGLTLLLCICSALLGTVYSKRLESLEELNNAIKEGQITKPVRIETEIKWYNAKDIVYEATAEVMLSFNEKLLEQMIKFPEINFKPSMKQTDADAIGATYIIDEDDYKETTVSNPFNGAKFCTFHGFDENGDFIFGEPEAVEGPMIQPPALEKGWVFIELAPTLNTLLQEYVSHKLSEEYHELDDWYIKASKIVPMLWD